MTNLTKTYKFIYFRNANKYCSLDQYVRTDYTFGNRMPKTHTNKLDVYKFFHHFDDRTTRKNFTDKPTRKIVREDFLTGPATEAAITLAFVKKFTFQLNDCRRKLTYLNKEFKLAETDKIKYPHGVNPMNYNVFNPQYYRVMIKHHKANLAIWRAKYNQLKEQGVYTYLELMK